MKLLNSIRILSIALVLAAGTWMALYVAGHSQPASSAAVVEIQHYVRIAAVYEGDIDWRFYVTTKMLESMAPQLIDKPMLLGHDWSNPNICIGRIVDSAVKHDQYGQYVEAIVLLNNDEAADMIKRHAYHAVSIGFMRIKSICMIDGLAKCEHQPGQEYKIHGTYMMARFVLQEVRMCEVSFINVPASEHARVLEFANHRISCSDSK